MTTEERHNRLDAYWKGKLCAICGFAFDQREGVEDMEEIEAGMVHKSCIGTESPEFTKSQKEESRGERQFETERGN